MGTGGDGIDRRGLTLQEGIDVAVTAILLTVTWSHQRDVTLNLLRPLV